MADNMGARKEDKKEPQPGSPESSEQQDMDAEDDDDLGDEDEFDLQEIAALNENLDNLNAALDTIEQRADSMKEKVLELLMSNREITKALREEQHSQIEPTGDSGQCNHRKGDPAKEA